VGDGGEIVVDARGHRCPTPTLRLRKALAAAPPGSRLRLLADDPMVRIDVPHFAMEAGVEIVAIEAQGAAFAILIRKPA